MSVIPGSGAGAEQLTLFIQRVERLEEEKVTGDERLQRDLQLADDVHAEQRQAKDEGRRRALLDGYVLHLPIQKPTLRSNVHGRHRQHRKVRERRDAERVRLHDRRERPSVFQQAPCSWMSVQSPAL